MVRWNGSILRGKGFTRQAKEAFDVEPRVEYCHPQYDFRWCAICQTEGRGALIIATLEPRDGASPRFVFRWDPKDDHLNVDIKNVSGQERGLFEEERQGYTGHVAKRVAAKLFEVKICIPAANVFAGTVRFKIHENIALDGKVSIPEKMIGVLEKDGESRRIE